MVERICRILVGLILTLGTQVMAAGIVDQATVPRYRFVPGQKLTYKAVSTLKGQAGTFRVTTDTTAWVLRKNPDGSHRIVLRECRVQVTEGSKPAVEQEPPANLGYFDLFDDGRLGPDSHLGYYLDQTDLFPRLPANAQEWQSGWSQTGTFGGTIAYKPEPSQGDREVVFAAALQNVEYPAFQASRRLVVHFDRQQGLVRRIKTENSIVYFYNGRGRGEVELKAIENLPPAVIAKFAAAAERYIPASERYEELTDLTLRQPRKCTALLAEAETTLQEASRTIDDPVFRKAIDAQLKAHPALAASNESRARHRAEILGRPAVDWQTTDLQGRPHASKDYRGKVLILDFWYRGCRWCMRAMPQVNQLADDFKGLPVVVLAVSTDGSDDDARFVASAMKLNHPVLKAGDLTEKFDVSGQPALIIIAPDGRFADIIEGYSRTLRKDVGAIIQKLLPRP